MVNNYAAIDGLIATLREDAEAGSEVERRVLALLAERLEEFLPSIIDEVELSYAGRFLGIARLLENSRDQD